MRPSWDETGLELAKIISKRAACLRSQVGAVVVSQDKLNVFLGYNGVPSGEIHCSDGGCPRGRLSTEECPSGFAYENCKAIHAEENALRRAGDFARSGTLYVTREPCDGCRDLAEQFQIERIIW